MSRMEAPEGFAPLVPTRKTGGEKFTGASLTLLDFWRWSASDLVSNATRGILAEFIVAQALGLEGGARAEWDAFDLLYPTPLRAEAAEGIKIEVKSASYLQSWFHHKLSAISFGIAPTRAWDATTNQMSQQLKRQADVYVFCLLAHTHKPTLDPLDLSQWQFFVLPTRILNERMPTQKSIGLASLKNLNPETPEFRELPACIQKLAP